jgi:hypothetical protein
MRSASNVPEETTMTGGWSNVERHTSGGAVNSVQRVALEKVVVPMSDRGARELGALYWSEVERGMRGLVRARRRQDGIVLELAGLVTLLHFGLEEPRLDGEELECRYPILGGLLTAREGGSLAIVQRAGRAPELELAVTGYFSRLMSGPLGPVRRFFYSSVQRPLHLAVSRRFLLGAAGGRA